MEVPFSVPSSTSTKYTYREFRYVLWSPVQDLYKYFLQSEDFRKTGAQQQAPESRRQDRNPDNRHQNPGEKYSKDAPMMEKTIDILVWEAPLDSSSAIAENRSERGRKLDSSFLAQVLDP